MSKQYFNSATFNDIGGVTVNVTKVYDDDGRINLVISLSDAALTARAVADGRTAWDNSDLYALTPCEPWPTVETEEAV